MNNPIVQRLNAASGKLEWVVTDDNYECKEEIARSTYAGMLHDQERNKKYYEAVHQTIEALKISQDNIHVLDIGTGTGILSMMAANVGATKVSACEVFSPMSETAKKVVKTNKFDNVINVINKMSTGLSLTEDMGGVQADVLVTEIFDTELIGEGVLPTLRDAHDRLLKSNCKVIPASAEMRIQLIESEKLFNMHKLNGELFNGVVLPNSFGECRGSAAAHEVQINTLYPDHIKLLTDVGTIAEFDFSKAFYHSHRTNDNSPYSRHSLNLPIINSGCVHGVLMWWTLNLDPNKSITLSMEPVWARNGLTYHWRDHWMQAVYYVKAPMNVVVGDEIHLQMFHDDYSVWFDVRKTLDNVFIDRPMCHCGLHVSWSRERFAMCNNPVMRRYFNDVLLKAFQYKGAQVFVAGDTSLLPILFAKQFTTKITYIEYSELTKEIIKKVLSINKILNNVEIVKKELLNDTPSNSVLVAEPYFSSSLLPWHNIQIWYLFNEAFLTAKFCLPHKAVLKVCLVDLHDLWKVQEPISQIEGFNLSIFDDVIEDALKPEYFPKHGYFHAVEPYAMWEFGNAQLSVATSICEFDFLGPLPREETLLEVEIEISKSGVVNGAVIWVDFEVNSEVRWSTGLDADLNWVDYSKQGVYFFRKRLSYSKGAHVKCRALFISKACEIMFSFE